MRFHVLTLFPEIITSAASASILGKALERGNIAISTTDIRDYATDKHKMADDYPYGGGPGMVMKPGVGSWTGSANAGSKLAARTSA